MKNEEKWNEYKNRSRCREENELPLSANLVRQFKKKKNADGNNSSKTSEEKKAYLIGLYKKNQAKFCEKYSWSELFFRVALRTFLIGITIFCFVPVL